MFSTLVAAASMVSSKFPASKCRLASVKLVSDSLHNFAIESRHLPRRIFAFCVLLTERLRVKGRRGTGSSIILLSEDRACSKVRCLQRSGDRKFGGGLIRSTILGRVPRPHVVAGFDTRVKVSLNECWSLTRIRPMRMPKRIIGQLFVYFPPYILVG